MVEYELKDSTLRIDARGWVIEPSIENSDACMGAIMNVLKEVERVEKIVLVEAREIEYDFEQTSMLVEIARIQEKYYEDFLSLSDDLKGCEKLFPGEIFRIRIIISEFLRKDPIGGFLQLRKLENFFKMRLPTATPKQKKCMLFLLTKLIRPLKKELENSKLISATKDILHLYKPKDRRIYREIFQPTIKPAFMLSSYKIFPPKDSKLIEKYSVGDLTIEIFRVPGKVRYVYHLIAPEFKLSPSRYMILEEARSYLLAHKPSEREFVEPEVVRSTFFDLGKTWIIRVSRSKGISLPAKEIELLASILTRYTAGFGMLELLLADEKVQDIYINSPVGSTPIYIFHSDFEECETNLILSAEEAETLATRFRLYSGRPLDEANPVLDTELAVPGGRARVCAITRPLALEGLAFAFRRHREKPWTFPLFIKVKFFNPLYAGLMSFLADAGRSILIAGGRSSGKTSLLNALMLEILRKYRIIVQEDTPEISVALMRKLGYNIERLKTRSIITRVETEVPPEEALRTALRLGDSCLIIGEVRSKEGLALYEAMRVGALAHVVAGTIHAESAYGVFDRVVNDLGVPPTSFKATDIITVCNMLRSPDGLHRFRRVTELTEVRKHWKEDPLDEGGFVTLMEYSAKEDTLKPTDTLIYGESWVLNQIAKRVREWRGRWEAIWDNILLRAKVKETMVKFAEKLNRPEILEAEWSVEANEQFHLICEDIRREIGDLDSKVIYERWLDWFKKKLKR